jgi:hypothetical protein
MAKDKPRNLAASVHQRLLNHATASKVDPNLVLIWYALERLLYRLSVSKHRDQFVVKGALLFRVWGGAEFRATKDLDLLGFLRQEIELLREVFSAICAWPVEADGLVFDSATIRIAEIREQQDYGGLRISVTATLGNAVIPLQIDVGFGDAITPAATTEEFPTILDMPPPVIRAYPRETVVAEKYEAIVRFGMANSRMKDYYDLWFMPQRFEFDGRTLVAAIRATFERRGTQVPAGPAIGLTRGFASDTGHVRQWAAFVARVGAEAPGDLADAIETIAAFLLPPTQAIAAATPFDVRWIHGRWRPF